MAALLALLWSLLAGCYAPAVARLGDPEFEVRDAADDALHAAGVWAYPAVVAGCRSPSPEVAARCSRLAVRPAAVGHDAGAVAVLLGWIEPDYAQLADDGPALAHLYRVARALDCPDRRGEDWEVSPESRIAAWFLPDGADLLMGFFFAWPHDHAAREGVARCREDIRFRFVPDPAQKESRP